MVLSRGTPRKLSIEQIERILAWQQVRLAFRQRHGTQQGLAKRLQLSVFAISSCIGAARSRSPLWRKRRVRLTAAQRRAILTWDRQRREFRQRHGTMAQLAQSLCVSTRTVQHCIRRGGRYLQGSLVELRRERSRKTHRPHADWRSDLLQAWVLPAAARDYDATFHVLRKPRGVREPVAAPPAIHKALGCVGVWFYIQRIEAHGVTVFSVDPDGAVVPQWIAYSQISRLLSAPQVRRRLRAGLARESSEGTALLLRSRAQSW